MIRSLDDLSPATAQAARRWLDASVAHLPPEYRGVVRDDMLGSMYAAVEPDMTPEAFATAVAGIPAFAAPLAADEAPEGESRLQGTWHGIPYDFRPPTGDRIRQSMWNPADPRLLRPRAFGAGWDLNLAAVAVRLGILEPDAEDVPFTSVPESGYRVAAALPLALTAAVVAHYVVRGGTLADPLPRHWSASGRPDAWTPKRAAARTDLLVAAGAGTFGLTALRPSRSGAERAGRLALATAAAGCAAAITVARSVPRGGWWVGPLTVGSMVGGAALPLLGLALAGRRGEQRRDLAEEAGR